MAKLTLRRREASSGIDSRPLWIRAQGHLGIESGPSWIRAQGHLGIDSGCFGLELRVIWAYT